MGMGLPSSATTVTDRLLGAIIRELPFFGPDQAICLGKVSFDQYRLLAEAQEKLGRRLQISYGSGRVEVLPNTLRSEVRKSVLRSFVWQAAEALGQEIYALGSTTLADRKGDYGFDPHESFSFRPPKQAAAGPDDGGGNEPRPGLLIEVENPNRAINRLPLCARAGVPEVWYDDLEGMRILSLQSDRTYSVSDYSAAFPLVAGHDLNQCLAAVDTKDMMSIVREFRGWLESLNPVVVS